MQSAARSNCLWAVTLLALMVRDGREVQAAGVPHASTHPTASRRVDEALSARLAALPLRFEANRGQFDDRVSFLARGSGYSLFLTQDGATLALHHKDSGEGGNSAVLTMHVAGGHSVRPSPTEQLAGSSNYFVGNDPSRWRTGVEGYARVRYAQVLPGVDIVYYGTAERRLEYDVVFAPGVDPNGVALAFEGAQSVEIGREGAAVLRLHGGGEVLQPAPVAYQVDAAGQRVGVDVRYVRREGGLGFEVGRFDGRHALVIDPTIVYSTYLGGLASDGAYGIALGGDGAAFVAGTTASTNFPTATRSYAGGLFDTFVAKINAAGSALVYATYLGGAGDDYANGIAIDSAGEAFVTGFTSSTNFPTASPLQGAYGGPPYDAFVTKLDAAGSTILYSTYIGGSSNDQAEGIAVDSSGEAFLAGFTLSTNFPIASPLQGFNQAQFGTAFVAKLNAAGSKFVYSTYLGGGGAQDAANGIAIDSAGEAFVVGSTTSTNFPTVSPVQAANGGGGGDAFLAKLNAAGSGLVYSTYLGGAGADAARGVAVDGVGEAFVVGNTASSNFPVASAFRAVLGGSQDAFVAKFNSAGSAIVYSTYLGGSGADSATGVAVDSAGEAFVAGTTDSVDFPTASPLQSASGGKEDAFVTNFAADGSALVYSTYLGGSDNEQAYCIAVDFAGGAVVAGETASANFPMASPLQGADAGGDDAFVTRVARSSTPGVAVPALGTKGPFLAALLLLGGFLVLLRGRREDASAPVAGACRREQPSTG